MSRRVKFDISVSDRMLICEIAGRVIRLAPSAKLDRLSLEMDIVAAHANGNPLRLADLLQADDFDVLHDVLGIRSHIDRSTGKLSNHFCPRYSEAQR